jgi:alpha-ketoglutarate-dependent taurine dioxygenase
MMSFETVNLMERIGTEVRANVATLLQAETGAQLRSLLVERGVLVFKELHLSDEEQVTLAGHMGSVRDEGEKGVFKVTLDKKLNATGEYLKGSFLWHMDGTHDAVPVFASLLSGRRLSEIGGQTEFANSYQAYEELSEETKGRIEDLRVVHSVGYSMSQASIERTAENARAWDSNADRTHNVVWTHKSGRKSLVIGCHASHVVGMELEEGRKLIKELIDWTTQTRFVYRHEWDLGDLLIWDNTGVLHRAEPYAADSGRVMHRTTLVGEEAFA